MLKVLRWTVGGVVTLWIAYTLFVIGGAVVIDPDTTSRITGVKNDDEVTSAIGLTYHGIGIQLIREDETWSIASITNELIRPDTTAPERS